MKRYETRFIPQRLEDPVCEYWRMSRGCAPDPSSRLSRLKWVTDRIVEGYPEDVEGLSWNGVYKDVDCLCMTGLENY